MLERLVLPSCRQQLCSVWKEVHFPLYSQQEILSHLSAIFLRCRLPRCCNHHFRHFDLELILLRQSQVRCASKDIGSSRLQKNCVVPDGFNLSILFFNSHNFGGWHTLGNNTSWQSNSIHCEKEWKEISLLSRTARSVQVIRSLWFRLSFLPPRNLIPT